MIRHEEGIVTFLTGLALVGIFFSTFITTLCLLSLTVMGFCHFSLEKLRRIHFDGKTIPFLLIFIGVLIGYFYSSNEEAGLTAVRVKLPFLFLPLSFYFLPSFRTRTVVSIHIWLVAATAIVAIPVGINALLHYDQMLDLISKGQPIPTPIEHVKYSMFNAYAAISGITILIFEKRKWVSLEYVLMGFAIAVIVILMHILTVRTGLVIFYISLVSIVLFSAWKQRSVKILLKWGSVLLVLALMMYLFVPSIRQKIGYMLYDWQRNELQYSDSQRMATARAAVDIWKQSNPFIGIGYGDVKDEINTYFKDNYDREMLLLPHNQFLLVLTGTGILGLILFVIGFYWPLWASKSSDLNGLLLFLLYENYSLSFLVENSLERSISVAFFLLFTLVLVKAKKSDNSRVKL